MAGTSTGFFKEIISPYLKSLMEQTKSTYGESSKEYRALYNQYVYTPAEALPSKESNAKHYEAFVLGSDEEANSLPSHPKGIERLYKRQLVVDLTMVCAAHCRYCLRAYYNPGSLTKEEMDEIVSWVAADKELKELLVTGGDPLIVPKLLKYFVSEIADKAPNIKIIRMGTRLLVQAPEKFNSELYSFFENYSSAIKFEIGLQVNHKVELTPEVLEIIKNLRSSGVVIYSQNVLLKGVNDDVDSLLELYDELRYLGVESHYLFHAIPLKGTAHFRTDLKESIQLAQKLTCAGNMSGRTKPMFAIMTDIGKVVMYEGSILGDKDENDCYEIQTYYKLEERQKWNPGYKLPSTARLDENGNIIVKYLDGDSSPFEHHDETAKSLVAN